MVTGLRQSGKTTLVRDLLPAIGSYETAYFWLDDLDERLRPAADPIRRLDHGNRVAILDEVQKQPALLDAVKLLADRGRGHRFLLLGSSQILLLQKVRETLAGRATLLELWPLALAERATDRTVPSSGLDRIWQDGRQALKEMAEAGVSSERARVWRERAEEQFLWGGYPGLEPLTREERLIWLRDFRRTYLERDLADLGRVADLDQFALAQNLLAARTAQLPSYSEVARQIRPLVVLAAGPAEDQLPSNQRRSGSGRHRPLKPPAPGDRGEVRAARAPHRRSIGRRLPE